MVLFYVRVVPFAFHSPSDRICLFVKDNDKFARDYDDSIVVAQELLDNQNINFVDKVQEFVVRGNVLLRIFNKQ